MNIAAPAIDAVVNVFLPGESPWATCISVLPDNRWVGRIDNDLVATSPEMRRAIADQFGSPDPLPQLHEYRRGDLLVFQAVNVFDDVWNWRPASGQFQGGRA